MQPGVTGIAQANEFKTKLAAHIAVAAVVHLRRARRQAALAPKAVAFQDFQPQCLLLGAFEILLIRLLPLLGVDHGSASSSIMRYVRAGAERQAQVA